MPLILPSTILAGGSVVTYVRSAVATGTSGTTISLTIDGTSGNFLVGTVWVVAGSTGFSATYNGVAMTACSSNPVGGDTTIRQASFYLASPASGSNTLTFNWTTSGTCIATASLFSGAAGTISDQQSFSSAPAGPNASTNTLTISSGTTKQVYSAMGNRAPATPTSSNLTIDQAGTTGGTLGYGAGHVTGSSSQATTWTISPADRFVMQSFNID